MTSNSKPPPTSKESPTEPFKRAVAGCMDASFAAMVTAPVHKGAINDAGIPFTGHTEYLAALTSTPRVVMMLAGGGLRVALVTTHMALAEVAGAITRETLEATLRILHQALQQRFGMTAEDAARAFERFWRSDPSRTRSSGGAGLGLAIVAAITEAHGGHAEVETAPGEGATFRVFIPLTAPARDIEAQTDPEFELLPEVQPESSER